MPLRIGLPSRRSRSARGGRLPLRLIIAVVIALITFVGWLLNTSTNPVTGESQRVAGLSPSDEIQFGLAAVPELAAQFGGPVDDQQKQATVETIGRELVGVLPDVYDFDKLPWEFSFTLLEDDQIVNAFALPGGPTFITEALFDQLTTEGQLAGVLGHEIGHVLHRHGAERMAKQQLSQGLTQSAVIATGDYSTAQVAAMVGNFVMMSYGREDELECDSEGIKLMVAAGYDPRSMIKVMEVLRAAGGGKGKSPEWASTHPDPDNRVARIEEAIKKLYPDGVPEGLKP